MTLENKSDAVILEEIQALCPTVTSVVIVGDIPTVEWSTPPCDRKKNAIKRYFNEWAHKEWV